jgi:hypothetical protein
MDDMEGQVRELLRRRADDVPPQLAVPPALAGRGQRRFAANAFGAAIVAIVLVAGVFAGVRAIGEAPVRQPATSGPPVASTQTCSPLQITATPALEGAMGSREGSIDLKNVSVDTCTLEGMPTLTLLDGSGATIDSDVTYDEVDPTWVVNDTPRPDGWPVVTLAGGEHAAVRFSWSNWCGDPAVSWRLALPDGGQMEVPPGPEAIPPCNGPGQPSVIEIGPVEPSTTR